MPVFLRYDDPMIVTRFAPSPTGLLHLGHAMAAITAHESGDDFLLRIEDIDKGRSRDAFILKIFYDLKWLGLSWDEPTLRQSSRMGAYAEALSHLKAHGLVYPCFCTRAEIAAEIARAGEAQHSVAWGPSGPGPDGPLYPGTCRTLPREEGAAHMAAGESFALRLDVAKAAARVGALTYLEHGLRHAVEPLRFGDIVIARKDMPTSYHLAVVVDDAYQKVNLVTRGEDLLSATHIQRLLQALLKLPEPAYAHHPLVLDDQGRKFSKRDGAVSLESLREQGLTPADIRARIGL
jgi:glutamyl-Q tRNA(Asp) synthetase